ncbi:unnamed protein product [Adineta steineri]|uniref:Uncharacterized protein n=1 Tax=Adineta steineri TaxID=433720 RepID=A0A814J6R9_9BILA|nr:unnamed protein product [Adineta steineri]CAF1031925.1 unnamed protein product [Adineta steineri]
MIWAKSMGNTTNHLLLCVSQSSRKTHRERPYVSRPFWPYEHHHHHNVSTNILENSHVREISPFCSIHKIVHENTQSRSVHIVKIPLRN